MNNNKKRNINLDKQLMVLPNIGDEILTHSEIEKDFFCIIEYAKRIGYFYFLGYWLETNKGLVAIAPEMRQEDADRLSSPGLEGNWIEFQGIRFPTPDLFIHISENIINEMSFEELAVHVYGLLELQMGKREEKVNARFIN